MKALSYKSKLLKIGITLVIFIFASTIFLFVSFLKIYQSNDFRIASNLLNEKTSNVNIELKKYLLDTYIDHKKSDESKQRLENEINDLENVITDFSNQYNQNLSSKIEIAILKQYLNQLDKLQTLRGFKDSGIEGEMRKNIHLLESNLPKEYISDLLMLRRNEKDFFLRKDTAYVDKHKKIAFELQSNLEKKLLKDLVVTLNEYLYNFNEIVKIEKRIGLTQRAGIQANLEQKINNINNSNKNIDLKSKQLAKSAQQYLIICLSSLVIFSIILIVLIFFGYKMFEEQIIIPASKLTVVSQTITEGNISKIKSYEHQGVLSDIILSINKIVESYSQLLLNLEHIIHDSNRENLKFLGKNDEVSIKLNEIFSTYETQKNKEIIRARFYQARQEINKMLLSNEILNYNAITKFLTKVLDANQSVLYVQDFSDKNSFNQMGAYAFDYEKNKLINKTIDIKEGLVGQVIFEKEALVINNVPDGYTYISSGLGKAQPKSIVIIPFIYREQVLAAIEISSFNEFTKEQIAFVSEIGIDIASAIHFKMTQNVNYNNNKLDSNVIQLLLENGNMRIERTYKEFEIHTKVDKNKFLEFYKHFFNSKNKSLIKNLTFTKKAKKNEPTSLPEDGKSQLIDSINEMTKSNSVSPRKIEYYLDS